MQLGSIKETTTLYKGSLYNLQPFIFTILLSAFALYLSTEYWYFCWIALVILCLYALKGSLPFTFLAGFFSYLLGAANPHAVLPLIVYWPLIISNAAAVASVLAIFSHIALSCNKWYVSFIFASGLTAQEFIISQVSPHGTVHSIAYTQISNLPIIQIASITGIWGITFLLALVSANIALAYRYPDNRKLSTKANLIPVSLLLLAVLFGIYRLNMPLEESSIKVGIASISTNLEQYLAVANKNEYQVKDTVQRYIHKVDLLAQAGAEVVLLPEKIFTIENQDDNFQLLSTTAQKDNVNLIVGVSRKNDTKLYNSAYVFSPEGKVLLQYDKKHLLSAFEIRYIPGNDLGIIGRWGVEICKDMDFTQPSLDYSRQGVNIVYVPALDFHDDDWSHARIAVMRGVEGNFAVARAGQWGLLTLSDSKGQIIGRVSSDGEGLLIGEAKTGQGKSVYCQLGDSFGWANVGSFILLSILLLRIARKSS